MADAGKLASVATPWTLLMTPARMKMSQTYNFLFCGNLSARTW